MRYTLLLCLLLVSCSSPSDHQVDKKMGVLVSIPPLAYFAKNLVNEETPITTLLPPGSDPHTYEPRPSQVSLASQSQVWFRLGEPFEKQIKRAVADDGVLVIDIRDGLPLLPSPCRGAHCTHGHHHGDPHIWLSPRLAQEIVRQMATVLENAYPEQAASIAVREQVLLKELSELDDQLTSELAPVRGRTYLVSHPAFAYLFQDYDLQQLPIEYEGKEPTARQLTGVMAEAREARVDRILVQEQFSDRGAQVIAKELDLPTYPVDPLAEDYPRNLRYIAAILVEPATHD